MREAVSVTFAVAVALAVAVVASPAFAGPDQSGTVLIDEPTGFPGVCDQPCYTVEKSFEYWLPDNPDNPLPLAGNNTYIYKISHVGGSGPFIPALIGFELSVETDDVVGAGHIASSPGTAPTLTDIQVANDIVSWEFGTPLANGDMSKLLYVHSPLTPGPLNDVSISAQAGLDAPGTCDGPLNPPVVECDLQIEKEGCVEQPPDTGGDSCQGKATAFEFTYTGLGCDASSHLQNPKKAKCIGGADGDEPVDIVVYGKKRKRWGWGWGWWGHKRHKKTVFTVATRVNIGDTVVVDAANAGKMTLGRQVYIKISSGAGSCSVIEKDKLHTSCSQPLDPGNQFGSASITSVTSTQGGTVDLEVDGDDCETQIDVVPGPHCVGKIKDLTLRYLAADCSATTHSQDPGKVFCTDIDSPTTDPVRIIISDSASPSTCVYLDETNINSGDLVTIDASTCGHSHLTSTTGYWIKNAITGELIQDGYFHTSCSQPLDLEDQIGGLQIFGMDTTQGGTVALGANVEYTYTVTNPNTDPVDNVTVDDNLLGNIVSGVTLAPGEVAVYTTTALIEEETTNIATVNGDVAGNACNEAEDTATITVEEPPEEPTVCTKKIASVLFRYDGPTIYGATVMFKAKSFMNDPVTYGPVDLITGVTVLSMPSENGYTIDGTAHGETDLGSKMWVFINNDEETIHTSCSVPFSSDAYAPLDGGGTSTNWFVLDFTEKAPGGH
jgi:hypothetical protein